MKRFKILFLTSLMVLLTIPSYSAIKWVQYSYFNNSGGLNDAFSLLTVEDNEASNLQNIVLTTYGSFKTRDGYTAIDESKPGACTGIKYVKFSNGNQYLIGIFDDDKIRKMDYSSNEPDGTWDDITSANYSISVTQNNLASFTVGNDTLIIEDGVSTTPPLMWHHDSVDGVEPLTDSPPNASVVAFNKNTCFAAGDSANPSTLYFTDIGNVKNWRTGLSGNINIENNDGSIIRALVPGFDALYVFKDYSIWRVTGDDKDNFQTQRMIQGIGCISPKSISLIGNNFFFISSQGDTYLYDGAVGLTNLSTKIEGTLKDQSEFSRFQYSSGLTFDKDYYLSITTTGNTTNDKVLIFDTFNKAWTKFSNLNINAMDVADIDGEETIVFGDYHGDTFKYPSGTTDHGISISSYYITKQFTFEDAGVNKDFKILKVYARPEFTTTTLSISVSSNSSTTYNNTLSLGTSDNYLKLLLHLNTVFNDSSISNNTINVYGNTFIDISTYKFGIGSAYFDGVEDYLSTPDSADWDFDSGDFTIDFWVRFDSAGNQVIASHGGQGQSLDTDGWDIAYTSPNMTFSDKNGLGLNFLTTSGWTMSTATWYHMAVVRNESNFNFYIDGTSYANATSSASMVSVTDNLRIGAYHDATTYRLFKGNIDEFRISKTSRWTADFTVPSSEYQDVNETVTGRFEVNKEGDFYQIKYSSNNPFEIKGWKAYVEPVDRI